MGGNASASIGVKGGTGPYTYLWNPGGNTTASVSSLSTGTYTVTIMDAHNCTGPPVTISITQPQVLDVTIASRTTLLCDGFGYITAHAATGGTPPYKYLWTPSGGTSIATTTNLTAGTYTITATDSNGCTATASETITYPPALTVSSIATSGAGCYGGNMGSALATASGGTPVYTYSWFPSHGTSASESNLSAGTYTITVTDSLGCSATAAVTITEAAPMVIVADSVDDNSFSGCNGSAHVSVISGGTPPYTYLWSPGGQTTDSISGQCQGDYCCTITQANGCSQMVCIVVKNVTGIDPLTNGNGLVSAYPNPCNGQFTISINDNDAGNAKLEIYNVLGQNILQAKN